MPIKIKVENVTYCRRLIWRVRERADAEKKEKFRQEPAGFRLNPAVPNRILKIAERFRKRTESGQSLINFFKIQLPERADGTGAY